MISGVFCECEGGKDRGDVQLHSICGKSRALQHASLCVS